MNSPSLRALRRHLLRDVTSLFLFTGIMLQSATAVAPGWWGTQHVLTPGAIADDYTVANLGQLKNVAKKAAVEFNSALANGAGNDINDLIAAWEAPPAAGVTRDDYAALTIGQLKSVARLFYDRLAEAGVTETRSYPWSGKDADDYAPANLGQLKSVFNFETASGDVNQNGMPDVWEMRHFGNLNQNPGNDFDNDGLSNLAEYQATTNPANSDTDDDGVSDGEEVAEGMDPTNPVIENNVLLATDVVRAEGYYYDYYAYAIDENYDVYPEHTTEGYASTTQTGSEDFDTQQATAGAVDDLAETSPPLLSEYESSIETLIGQSGSSHPAWNNSDRIIEFTSQTRVDSNSIDPDLDDTSWWWQHGKVRYYLKNSNPHAPTPTSQTVLVVRTRTTSQRETFDDWPYEDFIPVSEEVVSIESLVLTADSDNPAVVDVAMPYADDDTLIEDVVRLVPVEFVTKGENDSFVRQSVTWNSVACPVITLTQVNTTPMNDGSIQLSLSGTVKDDTSDCTPTPGKQISKINIDVAGQTSQVDIDNIAQPDPTNFWRPYPFDGSFTASVTIPASQGDAACPVTLSTEINAGGMAGQLDLVVNQRSTTQSRLTSLTFANGYDAASRNQLSLQTTADDGTTQTMDLRQTAVGAASFVPDDAALLLSVALPGFTGTTETAADAMDVLFIENTGDAYPTSTSLHLAETGATSNVFVLDQSTTAFQFTTSQTSQNGPGNFFPTIVRIPGGSSLFSGSNSATVEAMDHEWQLKYFADQGGWYVVDDNEKPVVFNPSLNAHTDIQTKALGDNTPFALTFIKSDGSTFVLNLPVVSGLVVQGGDISSFLNENEVGGWEKKVNFGSYYVYIPKPNTPLTHGAAYSPAPDGNKNVIPEILWRFVGTKGTVVKFNSPEELVNDLKFRQTVVDLCTKNPKWSFGSTGRADGTDSNGNAYWIGKNLLNGLANKDKAYEAFYHLFQSPTDYELACLNAVDFIAVRAASLVFPLNTWKGLLPNKPDFYSKNFNDSREPPGSASGENEKNTASEESFASNWIPGDSGSIRNYKVDDKDPVYGRQNVIYLGGCYDNDADSNIRLDSMKSQGYFYGHIGNIDSRIQNLQGWINKVNKFDEVENDADSTKIIGTRLFLKQPIPQTP